MLHFLKKYNNILKIKYDKQMYLKKLNQDITKNRIKKITKEVLSLNKNLTYNDLYEKRYWNYSNFNKLNTPIVVANLQSPNKFSLKQYNKIIWTLELPIKMPYSDWRIPIELHQFSEFFSKCCEFEKITNPDYDKNYVYVSIDQRYVEPYTSQRRSGWHSDCYVAKKSGYYVDNGFGIENDSIYACYDCLPTEFCAGPFDFAANNIDGENKSQVLNFFESVAANLPVITYKPYTVLKFGPDCVHRVSINNSSRIINRTFIKLVFSQNIFNRTGNDHNYLFDYNWNIIDRSTDIAVRNNSNLKE